MFASSHLSSLATALGPRTRHDEPLERYTAMRVGGPADLVIACESVPEVLRAVALARLYGVRWLVLGGGCNVLVSDAGVRGLVIINRAASISFDGGAYTQSAGGGSCRGVGEGVARAEAGALLAVLARGAVEYGLAGLEWAAGLPGTVGGAVVGNAGAFDGDIAGTLRSALVLEPDGTTVERPPEWFDFAYRTSRVKRQGWDDREFVVLEAEFGVVPEDPESLEVRACEILEWRRTRHPSGATMGSTFKNPTGSHAGYLIEQAGLLGYRIGGAQISEQHGNFFMNTGGATASDVLALVEYARAEVEHQFGVEMELEIELAGAWNIAALGSGG